MVPLKTEVLVRHAHRVTGGTFIDVRTEETVTAFAAAGR